MFQLLGATILGIGCFVLLDDSVIREALSYVPTEANLDSAAIDDILASTSFLDSAAYGIIACGSLVFVIGFCGCVGALKESKCLLAVVSIRPGILFVKRHYFYVYGRNRLYLPV